MAWTAVGIQPSPSGPPVRVRWPVVLYCAKERDVGLAPPSALAGYMHSVSGLCPSVQHGSLWMGWGRTAMKRQLRGMGLLASDPDVSLLHRVTHKHNSPLSQRASVCGERGLPCREGFRVEKPACPRGLTNSHIPWRC